MQFQTIARVCYNVKLIMKKKIVMLTAFDFPTASILDNAGIDYILVGDSLAATILGYKDTKSITFEEMLHHVKAVMRGSKKTKVIADMPIGSYKNPNQALKNAKKFMNVGCFGVKIEGRKESIVKILFKNKIPIMGHLGLLPQTANKYIVKGKLQKEASEILNDALVLEKLGVFALVLECIPEILGKKITERISIPTIGIGAGRFCGGQVLVLADVIGLSDFNGKMIKRFANVKKIIENAVEDFKKEVIENKFPGEENIFN